MHCKPIQQPFGSGELVLLARRGIRHNNLTTTNRSSPVIGRAARQGWWRKWKLPIKHTNLPIMPELEWIQNNLGYITWPVVVLILLLKYGGPLLALLPKRADNLLINRVDGLEKLTSNDYVHEFMNMRNDIDALNRKLDRVDAALTKVREDVAWLKAKANGK